jgi:hypothetical protein
MLDCMDNDNAYLNRMVVSNEATFHLLVCIHKVKVKLLVLNYLSTMP